MINFPELPLDDDDETTDLVSFHVEDAEIMLPDEQMLSEWLLSVASAEQKLVTSLNFIFCSDEYLRQINVQYLDHDYYTDIITFPHSETGNLYGDLFISTERVAENATLHQTTFEQELRRVMVHGVLHLGGYGDKTPEETAIMREKEDFYLHKFTH